MKGQEILFSSKSDEWGTPYELYSKLEDIYGKFTLDPCATVENHKVKKYFTMHEDGLSKSWAGEHVFMNPPYSKIKLWMKKAADESLYNAAKVVCLVPARTDTKWWHNYAMLAKEIGFVEGRIKFVGGHSNHAAPFPSAIVYFDLLEQNSFVEPYMHTFYALKKN